jgi:hypothetical protein
MIRIILFCLLVVAFQSTNAQGIAGCTDTLAYNYDSTATSDDGSCVYCDSPNGTIFSIYLCTYSAGLFFDLQILNANGDTVFSSPPMPDFTVVYLPICLDPYACYTAVMSNSGGYTGWYNGYFEINAVSPSIYGQLHESLSSQSIMFSIVGNCNEVYGCTNVEASNYNPYATIEDGSCNLLFGCTDSTALNYNATAEIEDGSCFFGCSNSIELEVYFNPGSHTNETAFNIMDSNGQFVYTQPYNALPNTLTTTYLCVLDTCFTINLFDSSNDGWDGIVPGFVEIRVNNDTVFYQNMEFESFVSQNFCVPALDIQDSSFCSVNIELVPDSLNSNIETVFIIWNQFNDVVSSVVWDFGDGNVSTAFWPQNFYTQPGTYMICVEVTYETGCIADTCLSFTYNSDGTYGPGGAQMNGFWLNVIPDISAGNNEALISDLEIFPNPTNHFITLSNVYAIHQVKFFTSKGNQINVNPIGNGRYDLSVLPSGLYLVQVTQIDGKIICKNLIKE